MKLIGNGQKRPAQRDTPCLLNIMFVLSEHEINLLKGKNTTRMSKSKKMVLTFQSSFCRMTILFNFDKTSVIDKDHKGHFRVERET